jgi:oligoendopeptidase F
MWKQYKENKQAAVNNYINALAKGGTLTLPDLYKTAGLPFDFSPSRIKELMDLVRSELAVL